jgi:hypothetical protein
MSWMVGARCGKEEAIVNPPSYQIRYSHSGWQTQPGYPAWNAYQCFETSGTQAVEVYMRYMVVIEEGPTSFGAYVSDFSGCMASRHKRR